MRIEFKTVPDHALEDRLSPLVYPGFCREYRADHEEGLFYRGRDEKMSDKLILQPLHYGWFVQSRFEIYERQPWFDVAFVDEERVVSTLSLRKESASNLAEVFLQLERGRGAQRIKAHSVLLQLGFSGRTSIEGNSFYAVILLNIDFCPAAQFELAEEFLRNEGVPDLPGEVLRA